MSSQHLWPASGIIATLLSPFGPVMGARLVNWARHLRIVGPVFCYLFPEEEGTHPTQRDGLSQVSLNAESITLLRGALRDAVREGLLAAGIGPELTAEVQELKRLFQQHLDVTERMREEATNRHVDTTLSQAPSRELTNCGVGSPLGAASGRHGFNNLVAPAKGLHFYAVLVTSSSSKSETKTSPTR